MEPKLFQQETWTNVTFSNCGKSTGHCSSQHGVEKQFLLAAEPLLIRTCMAYLFGLMLMGMS